MQNLTFFYAIKHNKSAQKALYLYISKIQKLWPEHSIIIR